MPLRVVLTLTLAFAATACGSRALKLQLIDASVQRPSNVAVYFTVDTEGGEPVPGLTVSSFRIYEDDKPVSELESKQTILNPEVAATHYTLLLIDMSGSVSASKDMPVMIEAAQGFAERVQKYQKLAVYVFDGDPHIHPVSPFGAGNVGPAIGKLATLEPSDPSTNLNGAIVEGIKLLRRQLGAASTPLKFGTLVVFTDGTDRAGRVTREQLHKELDGAEVDILVIGVGAEIDQRELETIGKAGAIVSKQRADMAKAFDRAAARIEAFSKRYYLLGYCSPARAGKHVVKVEANADGKTGTIEYPFDAAGFAVPCDPTRPPSFNVRRPKPRVPAKEPAKPAGGRF